VNRRDVLSSMTAVSSCLALSAWGANASTADALEQIEVRVGGRIGVFALDVFTGRVVARRPDEKFAMCSTFKWLLAAQLLANVDRGLHRLDDAVTYGRSDLLDYAPFTGKYVAKGRLTLGELGKAAVTLSDNTAANLLLSKLGGPAALTAFARELGDAVTRLDRIEPELNSNAVGDTRDTTTPRGMVASLQSALVGEALSPQSRTLLLEWLFTSETGHDRLRAGMPVSWKVGDKTGSGARGAVNDVAIALPPSGRPILVASYMSDSESGPKVLNAAHAEVARVVASTLWTGSAVQSVR
jgi:beta-lactamase class A